VLLKDYVPLFISENNEFGAIYEILQSEIDELKIETDDIRKQFFIPTATWGINIWENLTGVITDTTKSIDERRANVLAKLRGLGTSTVEVIRQIAKSFIDEVEVIEHNSEYYFEIDLLSHNGFPYDLNGLYNSIEQVKPAHLDAKYKLISITDSSIYFAITSISGDDTTIYPWTPKMLESKVQIDIATVQPTGLENTTIYPWTGTMLESKAQIDIGTVQPTELENITVYPK
jgi:hypothetical protein